MSKLLALCAVFFVISFTSALEPIAVKFLYKSNAVLNCSATGWPEDSIEFYRVVKDGDETKEELVVEFEDEKGRDKVEFDDGVMTLKDVRKAEIKAEYYCKSTESEEKQFFKNEIEPFLMVPEKQSFTITEGGSAKFECQILYGQEVGIEWSWNRNGTDIDPIVDEAIKITSNETHSVMTINKVTESHIGLAFCWRVFDFRKPLHWQKMAARRHSSGLLLPLAALVLFFRVGLSWVSVAFVTSPALRGQARPTAVARAAEASAETSDKAAGIIAEQLGVDKDKVTKTATLTELGADSLDIVETVMALEEGFDVELPDEETTTLKSVGDVMDLVQSKL